MKQYDDIGVRAPKAAPEIYEELAALKKRVAILELKDMPLHPLHTRKWISAFLDQGYPLEEIRSRRTGKSTAQALTYIAEAIENPGKHIVVCDHHDTLQATDLLLWMMCGMVNSLRLKHIHFDKAARSIIFENRDRGNE